MGQKIHPYSFRLGYIKDWHSVWFARKKDYPIYLFEDAKIRSFIKKSLSQAAISKIDIERASERIRIKIYSARPGIIIGRKGSEIDKLRDEVQGMTGKEVFVDIKEIKNAGLDAQLVSENIAYQLERRIAYRRAMKKTIQTAINGGAGGIKIRCSGRLGGAEIARSESLKEGKIPLQTIRADIDYGFSEAKTTYGLIGVKVWIYKGDIIKEKSKKIEVAEVKEVAENETKKTI